MHSMLRLVKKNGVCSTIISPNLPNVMNTNLNQPGQGGTNAVFSRWINSSRHVFQNPLGTSKKWHTILFVPYEEEELDLVY